MPSTIRKLIKSTIALTKKTDMPQIMYDGLFTRVYYRNRLSNLIECRQWAGGTIVAEWSFKA
jgi:hypothetical protein